MRNKRQGELTVLLTRTHSLGAAMAAALVPGATDAARVRVSRGRMIYKETFGSADPSLCSHPPQRPN